MPKEPKLLTTCLGRYFVDELQREARLERLQVDDDTPRVPSPLDSPQSRRAITNA